MDKFLVWYLKDFLTLENLNTLIKVSKIFAEYKKEVRKFAVDDETDVYRDTNNRVVKKVLFYKRPQICQFTHYKDGQEVGEIKRWYKKGQLATMAFFKDGQLDGESKVWYDNGQLAELAFYKDGQLDGEFKQWFPDGRPHKVAFYKEGHILWSL